MNLYLLLGLVLAMTLYVAVQEISVYPIFTDLLMAFELVRQWIRLPLAASVGHDHGLDLENQRGDVTSVFEADR